MEVVTQQPDNAIKLFERKELAQALVYGKRSPGSLGNEEKRQAFGRLWAIEMQRDGLDFPKSTTAEMARNAFADCARILGYRQVSITTYIPNRDAIAKRLSQNSLEQVDRSKRIDKSVAMMSMYAKVPGWTHAEMELMAEIPTLEISKLQKLERSLHYALIFDNTE